MIEHRTKALLSVKNALEVFKSKLFESDLVSYIFLLGVYLVIRIPDAIGVTQFHKLLFPLNFLYLSETLFSGIHVNPEIAHNVISPAHANLVYPPGIYMLGSVLGSVRNTFYFLLVMQATVPLLAFNVLRHFAPRVFAFSVSILLAYYCTSADTWYPDFIIQPLMLGVLFALITPCNMKTLRKVILGICTGIIIVLKHNIGVLLLILCGAYIFLSSLKSSGGDDKKHGNVLAYIVISGFAIYGCMFFLKLPNWFDRIAFLAPYLMFWTYVCNLFIQNRLELDGGKFIYDGTVYATQSLILPLVIFIYFGSVIGFQRYWYSLFGMGFDYIAFWNFGLLKLIRGHIHLDGYGQLYGSFISALILFGPFMLNIFTVVSLYIRKNLNERFEEVRSQLKIISIGVMAVFLLFPLEDMKIAQTKFIVFVIVFVMMVSRVSTRSWPYLTAASLIMLIPVTTGAYHKAIKINTDLREAVRSSDEADVIQLPLDRNIDHEITVQTALLKNAVKGDGYFIFNSPKYNLIWLNVLAGNAMSQHYVRFDDVIMNRTISDAVINKLDQINYVVVATDEYESYLKGKANNSEFGRVMAYIIKHYSVVDQYVRPNAESPAMKHMDSFMVLKRGGPH